MGALDVDVASEKAGLTGQAKVLLAPVSAPLVTKFGDFMPMVADATKRYLPLTPYRNLGLAADASEYSRAFEFAEVTYQQPGVVIRRIQTIERTFTASMGSITPENIKLMENSALSETIAAAANNSAQTAVPFGSFDELIEYRLVVVGQYPSKHVAVTEPGGKVRFFAYILNRVTLAAEDGGLEFDAENALAGEVAFTASPEPGENPDESWGRALFETAGVISAV
jgi:hypothetical protein